MAKQDILVSVTAVLRNCATHVEAFVADCLAVLEPRYANFEIVLIDNSSSDDTRAVVARLCQRSKCVRLLALSRRCDYDVALTAGFDSAIGDYVVTMQTDFDPPSEIPAMLDLCRAGSDAVLGVDLTNRPGPVYHGLRWVFARLTDRLCGFVPVPGQTGFRVLSRHAVSRLSSIRRRRRYFPLLAGEIGLRSEFYPYVRINRSGRRMTPRLLRLIRIGTSVLVHQSLGLLRFVSVLGVLGSFLSVGYSLYVVAVLLIKKDVLPGWTTLSLQVSGLFLLVFIMLTLLGEYVGRVLEEVSEQPLYYVRDEVSSPVMLADATRTNVLTDAPNSSLK